MPCLQGLQSTPLGDALNTQASGYLFLEMRLRSFYFFTLSLNSSPKGRGNFRVL